MQLFYWLNSLAGRSAAFDAAMRFFYVCAVPLLWTALLALLLIPRRAAPASQPRDESNRGEIAHVAILLSAVCVVAGCALSMMAATFYARHWLGMENLSSRPFITHWVNLLVVEPNDNSFPCPETILAGGAATLLWAASPANGRPNAGAWGWGVAIGLSLARVFCGTNYPIDVFAGLVLGFAWAALPLALGRVSLWLPSRDGVRWRWKLVPQAALSGLAMIGVVAFAANAFGHGVRLMTISKSVSATDEATLHEGEGGAVSANVEGDVPRASEHYGRQPLAEAHLRRAVAALRLPYALSDLEVAQIRVGQSNFRVAQARFEVVQRAPNERRRVAQMAVALVKTCFAHDASLQNVDVTGLVSRRVAPIQGASAQVERKAIPVFTASVQRRNLLLTSGPVWANAPGTDAGSWLRARSRLYIDPKILPATPEPTPTAKPTSIPKPTPKANRPRIIPPLSTKPTTPKAAKPRNSKPKVAPKTPLSKAPPKINPPRPTIVAPKRAPQVRPNSARVTTRKPSYRRKWRARRGTSTRRRRAWRR